MLYMIAMDYLPIQATSVPCERVFSSAKETDTNKQNRMSTMLMEALQLLKFSLKKERLSFMRGWSTPEAAMLGSVSQESRPTHNLATLLVDDPERAVDNMLGAFTDYDQDGNWWSYFCYFYYHCECHVRSSCLYLMCAYGKTRSKIFGPTYASALSP